jgi:hypothetical protein
MPQKIKCRPEQAQTVGRANATVSTPSPNTSHEAAQANASVSQEPQAPTSTLETNLARLNLNGPVFITPDTHNTCSTVTNLQAPNPNEPGLHPIASEAYDAYLKSSDSVKLSHKYRLVGVNESVSNNDSSSSDDFIFDNNPFSSDDFFSSDDLPSDDDLLPSDDSSSSDGLFSDDDPFSSDEPPSSNDLATIQELDRFIAFMRLVAWFSGDDSNFSFTIEQAGLATPDDPSSNEASSPFADGYHLENLFNVEEDPWLSSWLSEQPHGISFFFYRNSSNGNLD